MLSTRLEILFPGIEIGATRASECVLSEGSVLWWNRPEPKPTLTELESVSQVDINAILDIAVIDVRRGLYMSQVVPLEAEIRTEARIAGIEPDFTEADNLWLQIRKDNPKTTDREVIQ